VQPPFAPAVFVRTAVLVLLFTVAGWYAAVRLDGLTSVAGADFWWHLRVGLGILDSHSLPRTGVFSQLASQPWIASSWLYEVAIAFGYRILDLRSLPLLAIIVKFALAVLLFILAGGLRRFWPAVALSALAQHILAGLQPLPMSCSVLALAAELILLMQCRRTASTKTLFWLPALFLCWANLDVQFVYGLTALLLFFSACALEQWGAQAGIGWLRRGAAPSLKHLGIITATSLAATVLTPYGWEPYGVFFSQATSAANSYFPDHQALGFRSPADYLLLLLVMAAFLALGLQRSRDLFEVGLLVLCTGLSFHSQSDAWLAVVPAVAILGNALATISSEAEFSFSTWECVGAAGLALILLSVVVSMYVPRGRQALLAKMSEAYPLHAADYIRQRQLQQPVFNSLDFGGFLTWYLPEYPVAIDGRTDLYGSDFNIQYAKAMNAEIHYSTFAPFNQAATVLLEKNSLMGKALPNVRDFKVAYSDDVAVVLVREEPGSTAAAEVLTRK